MALVLLLGGGEGARGEEEGAGEDGGEWEGVLGDEFGGVFGGEKWESALSISAGKELVKWEGGEKEQAAYICPRIEVDKER